MKLLQINTSVNTGSTGRIMEEIGQKAISSGFKSTVAYYKSGPNGSRSKQLEIGNFWDRYIHGIKTRLLDLHGFGSKKVTEIFIERLRELDPDIIGLHNLHGYYLNVEILFRYLKEVQKPIVWTFHDCWPFTGHCVHFERVGCEKWKTECYQCPQKNKYPASYGLDNSRNNFQRKKELFNGLENLIIVTPSIWLERLVKQSFLHEYPVEVINNGIDINMFHKRVENLPNRVEKLGKKILLGVASVWDPIKGFKDFLKLQSELSDNYQIVLVGLNDSQINSLPDNVIGLPRTENIEQLVSLYSAAEAFINPTWSDNFPTTNIEALACGTPVITYNTGGSPEAVDEKTGFVVSMGDIGGIVQSLKSISERNRETFTEPCRKRAVELYNKEDRFQDYIDLYEQMLSSSITY